MLNRTPSGLREINQTFGDAMRSDFEAKNIVSFELPYSLMYDGKIVTRSRCHRLLVDNFIAVFEDIKAAGFEDEAKDYGGIYARRNIRGASHPSTHTWGIAIDLEPTKYPLASNKRFPDEIVAIFEKHGFFYGGNFKGRKDPMHFQFAINY